MRYKLTYVDHFFSSFLDDLEVSKNHFQKGLNYHVNNVVWFSLGGRVKKGRMEANLADSEAIWYVMVNIEWLNNRYWDFRTNRVSKKGETALN